MLTKIDHIGLAVSNLEEALKFYEGVLGLKSSAIETVEEQKVKIAFLSLGESKLELLQPTDPESPVARFINSRGEGVHHIALKTENIEKVLQELEDRGVRLIDKIPRQGAGGKKVAFLHPSASFGALLELCEEENI